MRTGMNRKRHGMKGLLPGLIALMVMLLATSCSGDREPDNSGSQVWVSEFLPFELDEDSYGSMAFHGDALYYISCLQQEEGFSYRLSGYSLADGPLPDVPLSREDGKGMFITSLLAMDADGSFYVIAYVTEEDGSRMHLCRFDAEGKTVYDTDISGETDNADLFAVDGMGRAYISCSISGRPCILLYTPEGSFSGTAVPDVPNGRISSMGRGPDGKVYAGCCSNSGGGDQYFLTEIDFDSAKTGEPCPGFPKGDSPVLVPCPEDSLLSYDRTTLYAYNLADRKGEALFDWLDQGINGSHVAAVNVLEDGRILAVTRDFSSGGSELALLKKVDIAQTAQKQTIVLGTLYSNSALRGAVLEFNRGNDKYHMKIREYLDPQTHDRTDALIRMNNDILSDDCPDLLDLADLDLKALASKGLFEDLNAYLDSSCLLDRSDFLDSLLDSYTVGNKLITIPSSFSLRTVFGWSAEAGDAYGWTLDGLMAYADAHPEAELFDNASRSSMMQYLMACNEDAFIDWSSGECRFDSDAFRRLLEFTARFPGEAQRNPGQPSTPVRIQNGEVLLYEADITDFDSIQLPLAIYGDAGTCIGFPSGDGGAGCILVPYGAYAITVKSNQKEGAWAFLESLLASADSSSSFFPPLKAGLEAKAADAVKAEYLTDESGEICLDGNGEPIPKNSGMTISYPDWEYTYRTASQDEVEAVLALIDAARPMPFSDTGEVIRIISEEAEGYYQGQKTVDEVAEIIQNRIQLYINEG